MKKTLQLRLYGDPHSVAPQPNQAIEHNTVPFGWNTDGIAMALSGYLGISRPGIGQSIAPVLHSGDVVADMNAWITNQGMQRFSDYMKTPAAQYHIMNLRQQQHMPMMEQANTESQWKAFVQAINAAFRKAGG